HVWHLEMRRRARARSREGPIASRENSGTLFGEKHPNAARSHRPLSYRSPVLRTAPSRQTGSLPGSVEAGAPATLPTRGQARTGALSAVPTWGDRTRRARLSG